MPVLAIGLVRVWIVMSNGVAGSVYDRSAIRSLEPLVGVIHELPLPKVSYLNPATPA
jgi:hypothetical protein